MNINRRSLIGGALALSILGGGVATEVASMSGASASGVYTTSKLARPITSDPATIGQPIKMTGSSVLTNGAATTIIYSFNKNVTRESILALPKANDKTNVVSPYVRYTVGGRTAIILDVKQGTVTWYQGLSYSTVLKDAKVRYTGNNIAIDLKTNPDMLNATDEFNATFAYGYQGPTKTTTLFFETAAQTSGYRPIYD